MLKLVTPDQDARAAWSFELNPPMGGAAGEAFTNTLASSGMHPAAVLAREAIQNSVDARVPGGNKVAVEFVAKSLSRAEKRKFVQASGLDRVRERSAELRLAEPNCFASLSDTSKPLNLLYIDDFNTTGLEGDPKYPDSKFYRFMLSLGDGSKEHSEEHTGGSYGFGKSVYSSNSAILTMFAYSRTVNDKGEPISLLFGCGYFRKHKFAERHYTGRSWFGIEVSSGGQGVQQEIDPLMNEEADRVAAELGFAARDGKQMGTSVLIVDSVVTTEDILKGVEDWWWPRLISNGLDVTVVDSDGTRDFPRPKKREHLKPFIDAYYLAVGQSPPNGKTDFRKPFNRIEDTSIGVAGYKILDKRDNDDYIVSDDRLDSVALIRAPLMVVAYYRQWNVQSPAIVGAFVADDEIDDVLRSAEPPAHDRWDPTARRLQDATGQNKSIVERVLGAIKRNLKTSQGSASPPPPSRPKKLALLEKTLAAFLTPGKRAARLPVDPSSAPIHLFYEEDPHAVAVDGKLRLRASFSVRLKAEDDVGEMLARVRVTCPVIEDGQTGDNLKLSVSTTAESTADETRPGWFLVRLKHQSITFTCETEPYDPLWTVKFVPEVEPVG
ncbi:hypothetical protein [Rhizobium sp. Leaf383]|uniref:hypothetical protein n=1 Tax=Rhizobium sp. Leaf383 TaxID=1736357 RepID=UPI000713450F|nr:hypothetical protein [Rhizobium sp. Leaf383]KQS76372.1 hypothetical protein ASG58_11115 [Rhizobium sp. Leaf383]